MRRKLGGSCFNDRRASHARPMCETGRGEEGDEICDYVHARTKICPTPDYLTPIRRRFEDKRTAVMWAVSGVRSVRSGNMVREDLAMPRWQADTKLAEEQASFVQRSPETPSFPARTNMAGLRSDP